MEISRRTSGLHFLLPIFFFFFFLHHFTTFADRRTYVIYIGENSQIPTSSHALTDALTTESHFKLLGGCLKDEQKAKDAILYSYTRNINGFAAHLTEDEALAVKNFPGVAHISPSRTYKLHTTHSWEFLGLEMNGTVPDQSLWTKAKYGEDVIIANIDSGVWPESESFKDDGMGPIPSRWKGTCENHSDKEFQCNRKLIGARYFKKDFEADFGQFNSSFSNARDMWGHGTHTLSTAAGGFVPYNNLFNLVNGTIKGGSPRARVAAYKACWDGGNGTECYYADILAAMDAAIKDGVDVISVSLGADYLHETIFDDSIAIGSLKAIKRGITVVASAGNSGPKLGSIVNMAPWLITVGASSMDRIWESSILFNSKSLKGQSMSTSLLLEGKEYPLISSKEAYAANSSQSQAELCIKGSLDQSKVKGKIVACLGGINGEEKGDVVEMAGGIGIILCNNATQGNVISDGSPDLPATHISYSDGLELHNYIKSTKSPMAYITPPSIKLQNKPAPVMASLSSRGPNTIFPQILKPDITAPGVHIIAAYRNSEVNNTPSPISIIDGTSVSAPHVSGVVGLLKALHPDWSPAAIKSAIMTTATTQNNMGELITEESGVPASPFSYGSGHIQPNKAMDPGLVYDLNATDYLNFLCAVGYNSSQISIVEPYICPLNLALPEDLNYPSITAPNILQSITITRRLKNVGQPGTYTVNVHSPRGLSVNVHPTSLTFEKDGEEKVFQITLELGEGVIIKDYVFGSLVWSDGQHHVTSPIIAKSKGH